ncbi:Hypothetical protein FKW44_015013 [Caligus rogercresseyi]|uniref:Uncharacterized protein n=1 Tax=Caligus rogercresseyi TaxID=217165 RepID=A0A7T8H0K2_CALRO|nr:Hypothetical protein FKW44_015013 [Caligus rogercresseyi]
MENHQHHSKWDPGVLEDPNKNNSMQWETVAYNKWGKRIRAPNETTKTLK